MRKVFILSLMLLFYVGSHGLAQVQGNSSSHNNLYEKKQFIITYKGSRESISYNFIIGKLNGRKFSSYERAINYLGNVLYKECCEYEDRFLHRSGSIYGGVKRKNLKEFKEQFEIRETRVNTSSVVCISPKNHYGTSAANDYKSFQSGNNRNNDVKRGGYNANQTMTERKEGGIFPKSNIGDADCRPEDQRVKNVLRSKKLKDFYELSSAKEQQEVIAQIYNNQKKQQIQEKEAIEYLSTSIQKESSDTKNFADLALERAKITGKIGKEETERACNVDPVSLEIRQTVSFDYIRDESARGNVMKKLIEVCSDKNGNIDAQAVKETIDILNKNAEVIGYKAGNAGNPIFGIKTANMQKKPDRQRTPEEEKAIKVLEEIRKACEGGLCIKKN
ncbi:MAG: hypothetical protein ACI3ZQ_06545 [Candidatus Cryptobacteroides sp.]